MIFTNPAGVPELACEECACRWFDRRNNACYECGAPAPIEELRAFERAREKNTAERLFCRTIRRKEHFNKSPQPSHERSNPTEG